MARGIFSFQVQTILLQSSSLAHSVIRWSDLENWKYILPMEKSHQPYTQRWKIPFPAIHSSRSFTKIFGIFLILSFFSWKCEKCAPLLLSNTMKEKKSGLGWSRMHFSNLFSTKHPTAGQKIKKSPGKKLVKSNVVKNFFREIAF